MSPGDSRRELPNILAKSHTGQHEAVLGSELHPIFELSMTVFETRDEESILRLAMSSVPSLGAFQACAAFLLRSGEPTADPHVVYAMEHAAMALTLPAAHPRPQPRQTELRLRRDLVEDLVEDVEDHSVFARSEAVGHNLHGPHYALAGQWRDTSADDVVALAVQRAAKKGRHVGPGVPTLGRRGPVQQRPPGRRGLLPRAGG